MRRIASAEANSAGNRVRMIGMVHRLRTTEFPVEPNILRLQIANLSQPDVAQTIDFLLDSGMPYTVVPVTILEALNIRPFSTKSICLQNGETIVRQQGGALFRYKGEPSASSVLFGQEDDFAIVGSTTLTSLGLAINPLNRQLLELPDTIGRRLAKLGISTEAEPCDLPSDLAENHDYYLRKIRGC